MIKRPLEGAPKSHDDSSRRGFQRILSSSIGCVLVGGLTGCGSDSGGFNGGGSGFQEAGVPSGYLYFPLFKVGQAFPEIVALTTEVVMDENEHVLLFAEHADGRLGLYYLIFELDAKPTPIVHNIRCLLMVGDMLGGPEVAQICSLDENARGQRRGDWTHGGGHGPGQRFGSGARLRRSLAWRGWRLWLTSQGLTLFRNQDLITGATDSDDSWPQVHHLGPPSINGAGSFLGE